MKSFRHMVFGGGGAAGYAFVGALKQLAQEPQFSFDKITSVAGTSVGALAALIVSLNYPLQEASDKLARIDLNKLADGGCYPQQIYRLFTNYGRYRGEHFAEFVHDVIKEKTGREDPQNVTFADLKKLGFKDLYIIATKLYKVNDAPTGKQKIFSSTTTPNTPVAAALRASAAAPIYFPRIRLKKITKGTYMIDESGDLYDDGGILNNYPIEIFDKPEFMSPHDENSTAINPHTLGFVLYSAKDEKKNKPIKAPIQDAQPTVFAESLVNSLLHQVNHAKLQNEYNLHRTILIDRMNVKLNDFGIDEITKEALIKSGEDAVRNYFISYSNKSKLATNDAVQPDKSIYKIA